MADEKITLNIENNLDGIVKNLGKVTKLVEDYKKKSKDFSKNLDTSKVNKSLNDSAKSFLDFTKKGKQSAEVTESISDKSEKLKESFQNLKSKGIDHVKSGFGVLDLGMIGLGGGIATLMKSAWEMIQGFSRLGDELLSISGPMGGTSAAIGAMYEAASKSKAGLEDMKASLFALGEQGVTSTKDMIALASATGNLQQMTGVAATEWASFTGELSFKYGLATNEIVSLSRGLAATGLNGKQLGKTIGVVNKLIDNVAFASKGAAAGIKSMSIAAGASVAVFNKMGISVETAGAFLEKSMNPENIEENAALYARLGISIGDAANMLNKAGGQAELMNKIMGNLPKVAQEIGNIQDPFARIKFAKTLGVPMEIASKMAGKTKGDIEAMMSEYQMKMKDEEKIKKQEAAAKASQAKMEDFFNNMKLQILTPFMNIISRNMPAILQFFKNMTDLFSNSFSIITPIMGALIKGFTYVANLFIKNVLPIIQKIAEKFEPIIMALEKGNISDAVSLLLQGLFDGLKVAGEKLWEGVKKAFSASPLMTSMAGVAVAGFALKKVADKFGITGKGNKKVSDATVSELAEAISNATSSLKVPGKGLITKAIDIGKAGTTGGLGGMMAAMKDAFPFIGKVTSGFSKVGSMLGNVAKVLGKVALPLTVLIGAVGGVMDAMNPDKIAAATGKTKEEIEKFGISATDYAVTFMSGFFDTITFGLTTWIGDKLGISFQGLFNIFEDLGTWIDELSPTWKNLILAFMPGIAILKSIVAGIKDFVDNFTYYKIKFFAIVDDMKKIFSSGDEFSKFISNLGDKMWTSIKNMFSNGFNGFMEAIAEFVSALNPLNWFKDNDVKAGMRANATEIRAIQGKDLVDRSGKINEAAIQAKVSSLTQNGALKELNDTEKKAYEEEVRNQLLAKAKTESEKINQERAEKEKADREKKMLGFASSSAKSLEELTKKESPPAPSVDYSVLTLAALTGGTISTGT